VFDIDRAGDRPVWKQLADQLRQLVIQRELRPGDQMPSETSIQQMTDLSRSTIRRAMRELQVEGLVEVRAPQGTFVREVNSQVVLGPGDWVVLPAAVTVVRANGTREAHRAGARVEGWTPK
jgi:DNA-binding transcriptional regulator YhcF (GntR family)